MAQSITYEKTIDKEKVKGWYDALGDGPLVVPPTIEKKNSRVVLLCDGREQPKPGRPIKVDGFPYDVVRLTIGRKRGLPYVRCELRLKCIGIPIV